MCEAKEASTYRLQHVSPGSTVVLRLASHLPLSLLLPPQVGTLACLQSLEVHLTSTVSSSGSVRQLACLSGLQQLQNLDLPSGHCSAADWPVLASLPKLSFLRLRSLVISKAALQEEQPSGASSMHVTGSIMLEMSEARLPSCLARLLQRLQELVTCAETLQGLVEGLQGHTALQLLLVSSTWAEPPGRAWPGGLLRQLPVLQDLTIYDTELDPCALIRDVASCPALASLHLEAPEEKQPALVQEPGPLTALAGGLAAASLRRVQLGASACVLAAREAAAVKSSQLPLCLELLVERSQLRRTQRPCPGHQLPRRSGQHCARRGR
jgi:hypothetical protein